MASITTRAGKGTPLTNAEVDANFTNLNTELGQKLVAASNLSDLASSATARTNLGVAIGSNVQAWDADLDAIAALTGTSGFLRKTAANTWSLDTSTYLTGNQSITFTGDATGSGSTSVALTLANSGAVAGTYGSSTNIPQIAVDAKGRITSVSNVAVSIPSDSLTFTGDVTGTGTTGSSTALTLANSGVTAGTYTKVTVDSKGRVTVGASISSSDVTTALGFTPANKAGDTFTGDVIFNGKIAVGTSVTSSTNYRFGRGLAGGTSASAFVQNGNVQSDVTSTAVSFNSQANTAAAAFTLTTYQHYIAQQGVIGAGSSITNMVGFNADSTLAGTTATYGYRGQVTSGSGKWNLFMDGTAANFLAGGVILNNNLGVGSAASPSYGTSGQFLKSGGSGAAPTWASLTSGEVTTALGFTPISGNQTITVSGDASGSGTTSISLTLANSGVTAGTYTKVTVDAKGRVTTGTTLASADLPTYTGSLTSTQVTTALGFTPYNSTNPNGYTSNTGTVTSVSGTGTVSGLTLSGTVTSSGSLTLGGTLTLTSGNVTTALGYTPYNSTNPSGYITSSSSITGSSRFVAFLDTRATDDQPQGKTGYVLSADFKNNTAVSNPPVTASGTFSHILTVAGWDTVGGSGGWPSQLSIGDGIAVRQATSATAWGAWRTVLHSNNYTSYSPSLTGSGASGTWGISITGSAGSVAWTNVTGRPTTVSSFTNDSGYITSSGSISGNAATATTLQTARNINGTSFNGSANITTASWGTARTLTIGSTGKSVDGSANVSWSLAEIGAGDVTTSGTQTLTNKTISAGVYSGTVDQTGSVRGGVTAVAALNIDCSAGNYFTKTINGASTFTVSNVPASRAYAFTLELTHTSGAVTWFSGVQWPGGTAPSLTTGKVHLFTFVTDDGGTTWRGASQVNYNS